MEGAKGLGAAAGVEAPNGNPVDAGAAGATTAVGVTGVGANGFGGAPKADVGVGVVAPSDFCPKEKLVVNTGAEAVRPNPVNGVVVLARAVVGGFASSVFAANGLETAGTPNVNIGAPEVVPTPEENPVESELLKNGFGAVLFVDFPFSSIRVGLSSILSSLSLLGGVVWRVDAGTPNEKGIVDAA